EDDFVGIPDPDNLVSNAQGLGVLVQEFGVSLARQFALDSGHHVAIGVTPKLQYIDTYAYAATVNNWDSDDWKDSRYRTQSNGFNLDVGVA
ncbi:conjugal transfer protein TraF, partial [Gluconobacter cerinus]